MRERGRTIIVSTHDDRLLPAMDQVVQMHPDLQLPTQELELLELAPGEVVFRQSEASDYVYEIASGTVEIVREFADGSSTVLATRQQGSYVGELGPMLGLPRSTTVRTRDRVKLMALTMDQFRTRHIEKALEFNEGITHK